MNEIELTAGGSGGGSAINGHAACLARRQHPLYDHETTGDIGVEYDQHGAAVDWTGNEGDQAVIRGPGIAPAGDVEFECLLFSEHLRFRDEISYNDTWFTKKAWVGPSMRPGEGADGERPRGAFLEIHNQRVGVDDGSEVQWLDIEGPNLGSRSLKFSVSASYGANTTTFSVTARGDEWEGTIDTFAIPRRTAPTKAVLQAVDQDDGKADQSDRLHLHSVKQTMP